MVVLQQDEILKDIETNENYLTRLVDKDLLHNSINQTSKLLNVVHFNIKSAQKNFDNLILLLEDFNLYFCDVIVLSETFQLCSTDYFNIPGYNTYYNKADYNKNDGVLILVKTGIDVTFSTKTLPNSHVTIGRMVLQVRDFKIGLTAMYRPPPVSKKEFVDDIEAYLESIPGQEIELLVGDINIDLLKVKDNDVNQYLVVLAQQGYNSFINSVTRFDSKTCLDHIFVKHRLGVRSGCLAFESFILDTYITDHAPTMLNVGFVHDVNNNSMTSSNVKMTKSKADLAAFKRLLRLQDWSSVLTEKVPEVAMANFVNIYKDLMKSATTVKTIKKKNPKKIKKWITFGIITSIRQRDKLKRKLLKQYSPELQEEYRSYRIFLNKLIIKQKNYYYKNEVEKNIKDLKKVYNIIKDATNENKSKDSCIIIKNKNGETFTNNKDMSNYCNNYFINIGTEMEKHIPIPNYPSSLDDAVPVSLFLTPVNKNDLIRQISSLKNNSAAGYDDISPNIIKQTHSEIITPLLYIFNLIFQTGIVPSSFKLSVVVPIHKGGSKSDIGNYRPISLISCFAKIFEKCLKDRLMDFVYKNRILSNNQYGFLKNSSTADALYNVTNEITHNLNNNKKCIAVFIDLAKAFDTVSHKKLFDVLERYGVRGTVSVLLRNYLTNRRQIVRVNNTLSNEQIIETGVPQGTVMGPILFLLYINSLLKLDVGGSVVSYADDTTMIFSGEGWDEVREKIKRGFKILKNWMETYRLSLNLTKTNYVAFSLTSANRPAFSCIKLDDFNQINEVASTKYLGVIIDQFLKWQQHIDYVSNRIRKLIHKFYILRSFLNKKILIIVYKALVESLISYGILVWGGLYNNALNKLNIIQKYILKIIYKKTRLYPTNLLFTEETCNIRTIYLTTICTYLNFNCGQKNYIGHRYKTRQNENKNLEIPQNRNNLNFKFISYLGPKSYNLLPLFIRDINNKSKFRKMCQKYIYDNFNIFIHMFN